MSRGRAVAALVASVSLAGCNGGGIGSAGSRAAPPVIELSAVVNALKCELSEAFATGDTVGTLIGPKVEAKLTLSNVVTGKIESETGAEFKVLGVGVEAKGGGSRTREATNEVEIAFEYDRLSNGTPVPAFCAALERKVIVRDNPFAVILNGVREEYGKIERAEPKVQLKSVSYTAKFDVTREVIAGASVNVLVFKLGATGTATREASQQLNLTFDLVTLPPRVPPG